MSAYSINVDQEKTPVVKVQNLTVRRGQYVAVQNVSFELYPGTSTAIVGPNGSGKSTLVQAMLDLIPRAAGTVEIFGRPIARLGNLRQQIGYMPQNFIFDRGFPISVSELVGLGWTSQRSGHKRQFFLSPSDSLALAFPWRPDSEKAEAVNQALQRVNAYHLRRQAIGTLSGGELKRVLLAYCLVVPRRLLVLDEAFAEVDMQGEAEFYNLLRSLMLEEGWTLLQVSHDLDMVSRTCDQVLCLNRSLICSGRPKFALSPQNLLITYGPAFGRYYHQH
ncbi:metal ABC transporter ATP-binding protein [Leptothermofonsia sp. ETS-13]|uniref:metal ABC transporter ATP-binding protein n=1 Tax=Leptothermofonsia sp. ETS-13 TaxID=3035696 RepID=UPI003BA20E80